MLRTIVRNYFETHGSFDGIDRYIKNLKKDTNLYPVLGFKDEEDYKSFYRKAKDKDIAYGVSKLDRDYILLMANYLEMLASSPTEKRLKDLFTLDNPEVHLDALLSNENIIKTVTQYIPPTKVLKDAPPSIQLSNFYTPKTIRKNKLNDLVKETLKHIFIKHMYIPDDINKKMRSINTNLTDSIMIDKFLYRFIMLLAIKENKTMKEIASYCSWNTIDFISQYKEYNFIFRIQDEYVKFTMKSGKNYIVEIDTFILLYENNELMSITEQPKGLFAHGKHIGVLV